MLYIYILMCPCDPLNWPNVQSPNSPNLTQVQMIFTTNLVTCLQINTRSHSYWQKCNIDGVNICSWRLCKQMKYSVCGYCLRREEILHSLTQQQVKDFSLYSFGFKVDFYAPCICNSGLIQLKYFAL